MAAVVFVIIVPSVGVVAMAVLVFVKVLANDPVPENVPFVADIDEENAPVTADKDPENNPVVADKPPAAVKAPALVRVNFVV